MDILLENAHLLKFTFHLGCVHTGNKHYALGCIEDEKGCGACGIISSGICVPPYTTKQLTGKNPDSIVMSINFVNKDTKLYEDLRKILNTFADDEISVQFNGNTLVRKRLDLMEKFTADVTQLGIKNAEIMQVYNDKVKILDILLSEFTADVTQLGIKNAEIMQVYNDKVKILDILLSEFEKMGCRIDECCLGQPTLENIPNEWYNYEESFDATQATITIMFHKHTRFYQTLKDIGFLEKYIPAAL